MKKTFIFLFFMAISSSVFADWCLFEETSGVIVRVSKSQFNPLEDEIYSETECPNGTSIGNPRKIWNGSSVSNASAQNLSDFRDAIDQKDLLDERSREKSIFQSDTKKNQAFKVLVEHYVQHLINDHGKDITRQQVIDYFDQRIDAGDGD